MSVASTAPDSSMGKEDQAPTDPISIELCAPFDRTSNATTDYRAIVGECPQEDASWLCDATSCDDRRRLSPWTLRFVGSPGSASIVGRQLQLEEAIWNVTAEEMRKKDWKHSLPSIVFDHDPLDAVKRHGCVDVIFTNGQLWRHMFVRMKKLQVKSTEGAPIVLTCVCASSGLPGDIMPLDLLRLPLTAENGQAVLKSLDAMVLSVGRIVGLATAHTVGPDTSFSYGAEVHRAYVKLSPASMLLPFEALVKRLCTHLIWKGTPYTLYYPGRSFHKAPVYSANFTAEE